MLFHPVCRSQRELEKRDIGKESVKQRGEYLTGSKEGQRRREHMEEFLVTDRPRAEIFLKESELDPPFSPLSFLLLEERYISCCCYPRLSSAFHQANSMTQEMSQTHNNSFQLLWNLNKNLWPVVTSNCNLSVLELKPNQTRKKREREKLKAFCKDFEGRRERKEIKRRESGIQIEGGPVEGEEMYSIDGPWPWETGSGADNLGREGSQQVLYIQGRVHKLSSPGLPPRWKFYPSFEKPVHLVVLRVLNGADLREGW